MNKPLSPHLQIYKPQLNSIMSILHRMTGIGFFAVMLANTVFLYSLVAGEDCYLIICNFLNTFLGKTLLIMGCMCVYYHFLNGIRYLIWGLGKGLEIKSVYLSGWIIILLTIILGIISWVKI